MAEVNTSATTYTVNVSSQPPMSGSMTVWALRDFVKALDEAGVPGDVTLVASHNDTRHFTGLRVHYTVEVAPSIEGGVPS